MRRIGAPQRTQGLPFAAVDPGVELELAGHAVRIAEVAQRRAAEFERLAPSVDAHRRGERARSARRLMRSLRVRGSMPASNSASQA